MCHQTWYGSIDWPLGEEGQHSQAADGVWMLRAFGHKCNIWKKIITQCFGALRYRTSFFCSALLGLFFMCGAQLSLLLLILFSATNLDNLLPLLQRARAQCMWIIMSVCIFRSVTLSFSDTELRHLFLWLHFKVLFLNGNLTGSMDPDWLCFITNWWFEQQNLWSLQVESLLGLCTCKNLEIWWDDIGIQWSGF